MNLKELVQEINSALDYNPDIKAYTDQVIRVVNRHYLQVSGQYPWKFLQKTDDIILRPDISGSSTNTIIVNTETSETPSRRLVFRGTGRTVVNKQMEGQHVVMNFSSAEAHGGSIPSGSDYAVTLEGAGGFGQDFLITRAVLGYSGDDLDDKERDFAKWESITSSPGDSDKILDVGDDAIAAGPVEPSEYYNAAGSGAYNDSAYIVIESEISDKLFDVIGADLGTTGTAEWKLEFRRFPLPKDCVEVLSIMDRGLTVPTHSVDSSGTGEVTTKSTSPDKGRLVFLDSKKEESLFLDRDNTGDPVVAIEDEWMHLEPPSSAPKLLQNTSSPVGRLEADSTYQYCYTFLYAGMESPPSPISEIKTRSGTAGTNAIAVYGLEDTTCGSTEDGETGRIKRLYRRKLRKQTRVSEPTASTSFGYEADGFKANGADKRVSTGPWLHVEDISEIGGTDRSDGLLGFDLSPERVNRHYYDQGVTHGGIKAKTKDGTGTEFGDDMTGSPNSEIVATRFTYHGGDKYKLIRLDEHGPRQWIRVYSPPSGDMKVEVRYLSRPRRMAMDNDYPNWPPQYHHLLVYLSLADICLQHGMSTQAQLYERKADQLLDRMRQKYLSGPARQFIRRGFDSRGSSGERWGTPTKL